MKYLSSFVMSFDEMSGLGGEQHEVEFIECVNLFFKALNSIFLEGFVVLVGDDLSGCKLLDSRAVDFGKEVSLFSKRVYYDGNYELKFLLISCAENRRANLIINSDPVVMRVDFV